jgi:hypothetical protein
VRSHVRPIRVRSKKFLRACRPELTNHPYVINFFSGTPLVGSAAALVDGHYFILPYLA